MGVTSKASTKNVDEDGEEQSLTFREIVQDTVEYDTDSGTISVGAKAVPDARKLAGLFAEHLLGDREFFSRADAANFYTLQPINDRGEHFRFSVDDEAEVSRVLIREVRVDEDLVYRNGRRRPSPWSMTVRDNRDALTKLTRLAPDVRFDDVHRLRQAGGGVLHRRVGQQRHRQSNATDLGQLPRPLPRTHDTRASGATWHPTASSGFPGCCCSRVTAIRSGPSPGTFSPTMIQGP